MAQEKTSQDIDALKEDISKLRTDLTHLGKTLLEKGKNQTDSTKEKIIEELRQELGSARDRGMETVESVEHSIQEKPFMSILIAFLFGLVLGKLFDRR